MLAQRGRGLGPQTLLQFNRDTDATDEFSPRSLNKALKEHRGSANASLVKYCICYLQGSSFWVWSQMKAFFLWPTDSGVCTEGQVRIGHLRRQPHSVNMGVWSSPTPMPLTSSFLPLCTKIQLPFLFPGSLPQLLLPGASYVTSLAAYCPLLPPSPG